MSELKNPVSAPASHVYAYSNDHWIDVGVAPPLKPQYVPIRESGDPQPSQSPSACEGFCMTIGVVLCCLCLPLRCLYHCLGYLARLFSTDYRNLWNAGPRTSDQCNVSCCSFGHGLVFMEFACFTLLITDRFCRAPYEYNQALVIVLTWLGVFSIPILFHGILYRLTSVDPGSCYTHFWSASRTTWSQILAASYWFLCLMPIILAGSGLFTFYLLGNHFNLSIPTNSLGAFGWLIGVGCLGLWAFLGVPLLILSACSRLCSYAKSIVVARYAEDPHGRHSCCSHLMSHFC